MPSIEIKSDEAQLEKAREILARGSVLNKDECYLMYDMGLFGNRPLTWQSYSEIVKSGWTSGVCIRSKKVYGWKTRYNIPIERLRNELDGIVQSGIREENLTFNQSMPDNHLILQGEFTNLSRTGPYLYYTTVQKPMKWALKEESKEADGWEADRIIKRNFCPSSLEDFRALQEIFPESVIEFSTYEVQVGDTPGRNTVFWEVRDY